MKRLSRIALILFLPAFLAACTTMPAQESSAILERSQKAMGGDQLTSLRFAGTGTGATFGQAYQAGMPWPRISYSSFSRLADYENLAFREDAARTRAEPNGGGAIPLMGTGEQRTSGWMRASFAWNMVGPAPVAAPLALASRVHDLWTTPHGVLKAALYHRASVASRVIEGKTYWAASFVAPGQFTATAYINTDGLVERIDSRMPHPVTGDTPVVTRFSGYRDHGGVKFPSRIEQSQGGFPVLDLAVSEVQTNIKSDIAVPELVRTFSERVAVEKVTEGVWFLAGGSHNSVAIEMKDHIMLVESPLYDGRSAAVFAAAKQLVAGKPVRYVVNSHHHFDHSGGLRTAVAEGAILVTSAQAKPYFDRILANPNSISPDRLAQSGRRAEIIGVDGKRTFSDDSRSVEVHAITEGVHVNGFNMVYLPKERILIQADAFTPGAPNAAPPSPVNGNHLNLVQNIERLKLGVDRILPLHGRIVPLAELYRVVGRSAP